jgi:hypothetical protein
MISKFFKLGSNLVKSEKNFKGVLGGVGFLIKPSKFGFHTDRDKLTLFPEKIQKNVMEPVPVKLSQPTLRSTKEREEYSE